MNLLERIKKLKQKVDDNYSTHEAKALNAQLVAYEATLECEELPVSDDLYYEIREAVQEIELECVVESLKF